MVSAEGLFLESFAGGWIKASMILVGFFLFLEVRSSTGDRSSSSESIMMGVLWVYFGFLWGLEEVFEQPELSIGMSVLLNITKSKKGRDKDIPL